MNVVLLVGDALRAQNMSCYGYDRQTTPYLDEIAENGTLYENCYANSNHTDPSFTTMETGLTPLAHGITKHGEDVTVESEKNFHAKTFAQLATEKGLNTIAIDWLSRWHANGFKYYGLPPTKKSKFKTILKRLPRLPLRITSLAPASMQGQPDAEKLTLHALKLLRENNKKPFFLMAHYWDTHTPFNGLPKRVKRKWKYASPRNEWIKDVLENMPVNAWRTAAAVYHLRDLKFVGELVDLYDSAIGFFDEEVSRIYEFLENEGILDDTLFVVTGDHGDNLVRNGMFWGHLGLTEAVTHVPLIVAGGGVKQGKRVQRFVQHSALFDGFAGFLDGNGFNPRWSRHVFTLDATAGLRVGVRDKRYRMVWSPSREESLTRHLVDWRGVCELYDLKRDPCEENNVGLNKPSEVARLVRVVERWVEREEPFFPVSSVERNVHERKKEEE